MNFKVVFKIVGRVLTMEGLVMLVPMLVALHYGEDIMPYVISSTVVIITGLNLACINASRDFYIREGFFTVGLIWLATGFIGALPFYYSETFPSFVDCLFESFSGFTTTVLISLLMLLLQTLIVSTTADCAMRTNENKKNIDEEILFIRYSYFNSGVFEFIILWKQK